VKEAELGRLRWRCRRGLLELDLILQDVLAGPFQRLSGAERTVFQRLLETPDNDLLAWLQGHDQPPDAEFAELVRKIR
jgi:antitoxin CptB